MIFRDTLHLRSTPTRLKNVCDFSETIKKAKVSASLYVYVSITIKSYYINRCDFYRHKRNKGHFVFQASFWSTALKTLISVSTVILLGLIFAYHALEVQVRTYNLKYAHRGGNVHLSKVE